MSNRKTIRWHLCRKNTAVLRAYKFYVAIYCSRIYLSYTVFTKFFLTHSSFLIKQTMCNIEATCLKLLCQNKNLVPVQYGFIFKNVFLWNRNIFIVCAVISTHFLGTNFQYLHNWICQRIFTDHFDLDLFWLLVLLEWLKISRMLFFFKQK